jgi:hypothetical protein
MLLRLLGRRAMLGFFLLTTMVLSWRFVIVVAVALGK